MLSRRSRIAVGAILSGAIVLLGCAVGGAPTGAGASTSLAVTATPLAPTATPTPPPHALAWFRQDASGVGQIWASVNDGAAHQVTHMAVPAGDCVRDQHWSPPVFSPNLTHIVSGWGSGACGDGPEQGDLYVVDATTGASIAVNGPSYPAGILLSVRQAGWVNNTTIWWTDSRTVYEYTLGAAHGVALGNIGSSSGSSYVSANDAVLRGNTLYYVTVSGTSGVTTLTYALRRFNMSSHTVLSGAVSLGSAKVCICSPGDRTEPGFDVSADGAHIVYQHVTASASDTGEGIASSQFFYANADGSGASRIARYATSNTFARMQFSPNGQFVSVSRAFSSPSVFTASVTSPGASGDPNLHFYHPDGSTYAVWSYNGATLYTGTQDVGAYSPSTPPNVERYTVGVSAGSVGYVGGDNPWYTIGS